MKNKILIFIFLIVVKGLIGQTFYPTVIPASGGFYTAGGNTFSSTVGETNILYLQNGTKLEQGFQHGELNIMTGAISGGPFCAGTIISVPFAVTGIFDTGNIFTAQLSNATGSFASAVNIGTIAGTTSGTISATIPSNTTSGTNYRLRVTCSSIPLNGTDNGSNIVINNTAVAAVSISASLTGAVSPGTDVTFTANPANGGTSPSYKWYVNSVNSQLSTANSYKYKPSNNDVIKCVLTSNAACATGDTATSNVIIMIVNPIVSMSSVSSNSPQCTSNTLQLSATSNQPSATYSWTGPNGFNSEQQNPSIANVITSEAGTYFVTASINGCTSPVYSTAVSIITYNKPVLIDTVTNQTICQGKSISFKVNASGAELSYQWTKGGADITSATNSSYYISSTKANDYNFYSCIISNTCTSVQLPMFILDVVSPPASNSIFVKQDKLLGDTITYTLSPAGTGPFTFQWFNNGNTLYGATSNVFNINSITCSDTGTYTCSIGNICDTITAKIAQVKILNCSEFRYNLSGFVNYDNKDSTIMTMTKVYLANSGDTILEDTTTDNTGHYVFNNLSNGTYKLSCSTAKVWGGVNPVDALLVNRTYIGLNKFTDPIKKLTADVNNDKKINPVDALLINRRYIELIHKFTISNWLFSDPSVTIDRADITKNITAICGGDVNASYIPPLRIMNYELGIMNNKQITVYLNKPFDIPVYLNNKTELGAIGLKFKVQSSGETQDIASIHFISVKSDIDGLIYNITNDGINVAWAAIDEAYSISPYKPLFYITAIINTFDNLTSDNLIAITSESVLASIDGNLINTDKLIVPGFKINNKFQILNIELHIYPNPFSNITNINYALPADANVEINLYNVLGEKIVTLAKNKKQLAGNYNLQYDGSGLRTGIYYCELKIENEQVKTSKTNIIIIAR